MDKKCIKKLIIYINMERKQCIAKFMGFLQRENIYDVYLENFNDNKNVEWRKHVYRPQSFKEVSPPIFFAFGFEWAATTEGYAFWKKMSDKWKRQLRKSWTKNNT